MKKVLLISLCLFYLNIFSQIPSFEKCFSPMVNSGLNDIISDTSGYLYAIGSSYDFFNFSAPGFFYKIDQNGDSIIEKYFYFKDENDFNDITFSSDGNLLICGYTRYCDYGTSSGLIVKISKTGDTLWHSEINDVNIGSFGDNNLKRIFSLQNGNIITMADTSIYFCNTNGDSIYTISTNEIISCSALGLHQSIIIGNQSGLVILDSAGQQQTTVPFNLPISNILFLSDSTYLVSGGIKLFKLDTAFNILAQYDLNVLNHTANRIVENSGFIWTTDFQGSIFASFDLSLQFVDSFHTEENDAIISGIAIVDSVIMVAGFDPATRNNCYFKNYSTAGNYKFYPVDLALTDISFDTAFVDRPSPLPQGVYRLNIVPRITVHNFGGDTIHSFYVQAESMFGFCGPSIYTKFISSQNLPPGQSMDYVLDTIGEFGLSISQWPYTYKFCPWISCPNFKLDTNHLNDYLCDSVLIQQPVGIKEFDLFSNIQIYPNPFQNDVNIEISQTAVEIRYLISDISGRIISNGNLSAGKNKIDTKEFSFGLYVLTLFIDDNTYTIKLLK